MYKNWTRAEWHNFLECRYEIDCVAKEHDFQLLIRDITPRSSFHFSHTMVLSTWDFQPIFRLTI